MSREHRTAHVSLAEAILLGPPPPGNLSPDFAVWVLFYGPVGGEAAG